MNYKLTFSLLAMAFLMMSYSETTEQTKPENTNENVIQEEDSTLVAPEVVLTNVNKPVFFDFTSTGCPGCGSWGKPTFVMIKSSENQNIVPIAVHIKYGDPMITDVSNAIASNRTGQLFTPQLWVNNTNGMVTSGGRINSTTSVSSIETEINAFKDTDVAIQVGVSSITSEGEIAIRYKTKALKELDGEYYLGIYVMENGIVERQSSSPANPAEHNNVIRASYQDGFGTLIPSEELKANAENEGTFNLKFEDDWNMKNLYATIIVWKKSDDKYVVVNANNNL